jgi:teichuronic acid biosynthesis glycosyltransferase TuaC
MPKPQIRVLVVTNMYPSEKNPTKGIFVKETVDVLRQRQLEIDVMRIEGGRTPLKYFSGMFRLWGRLMRKRYDLIHAYYVYSGIVARMQSLCPVVLTLCGSDVNLPSQRPLSRWLSRRVSKTIVQSQEMKDLLGRESATVLPFGVNLSLFEAVPQADARSLLRLDQGARFALFPYAPHREGKRHSLFVAAVDKAKEEVPELAPLVLENLPREQVPLCMSAADVMVLTSEAEGSPTTVKEALACGLPIVAVDVGDVRELISGVDGCWICPATADEIAEGILRALEFGRRTGGRERALQMSSEVTSKRLTSLYEELLLWS